MNKTANHSSASSALGLYLHLDVLWFCRCCDEEASMVGLLVRGASGVLLHPSHFDSGLVSNARATA